MKMKKMMMLAAAVGCLTLGTMPILAADFGREPVITVEDPRIEEGVTISGVDVSGMTEQEARKAVTDAMRNLSTSSLTVNADGEEITMSWMQLGFDWDMEETMAQALVAGKGTGYIGKYKALSDLEAHGGQYTVPTSVEEAGIDQILESVVLVDGLPQDATISRKDGEFVITEHVNGRQVDKEATREAIQAAIADGIAADMKVEAVLEVAEPAIKTEDLAVIKDELGSCTTDVGGTENRYSNVKVASGNINGKVLMPGESASASTMMKTRIPENGYKLATQYANGKNEQAYGGGVCQVSSTLYNALLEAELQIDERHPHSMVVSYLPPSKDAAIAEGFKDLVFTNNTEYPIYIEAHCANRELTFTIYGVESRPENREVKYVSHTVYKNQPADIIKYDPNQPITYKHSEGDRHPSCKSYLEKVVYENGEEVSRETLHTDQYISSAVTITYGSMGTTPGVDYPEGTQPVAPVVPDPGVTDPGVTDPGVTDPGVTDPGVTDPGATEPAPEPAPEQPAA